MVKIKNKTFAILSLNIIFTRFIMPKTQKETTAYFKWELHNNSTLIQIELVKIEVCPDRLFWLT